MSNGRRSIEVFGGSFWFIGWLFTIGFVKLSVWEAAIAVVIWPYFLGVALRVPQ